MRRLDAAAGISATAVAWHFVDPGGNGWASFVGINPGNGHLYISSDMKHSLFRSRDRGESWEPIANPVPGTTRCIAADPRSPDTLYMSQAGEAPGSSGIWLSPDDGDNWELVCPAGIGGTSGHGGGMGHSALVDPADGSLVYWAAEGGAVHRSRSAGRSWEPLCEGLPAAGLGQLRHLNALESDRGTEPEERLLYYPTVVGLFRLRGAGRPKAPTWELVKPGVCTQVALGSEERLYAAFPREGLFMSRDGGARWEHLSAGLDGKKPYRVLASSHAPVVYVATMEDRGVYRSGDGGASFALITHNRHDEGNNWPLNYRGLEAVSAMTMLLDPHDPDTLYLDYNKKTHDGGRSWRHFGTHEVAPDRWSGTGLALLTEYAAEFDPRVPGRVWLGFSDIGLALTEDGGESLHCVPSYHRGEVNQVAGIRDGLVYSSGSCPAIALDPERPTTIWASLSGKQGPSRAMQGGLIIKSVDGGWNWDPIGPERGLPDGIVRAIKVDPTSPVGRRRLFVASYGNGIYLSEDGGDSFRPCLDAAILGANTRVMDLALASNDPRILHVAVGGTRGKRPLYAGPEAWPRVGPQDPGGVWTSRDGGTTWARATAPRADGSAAPFIPNVLALAAAPEEDATLYAAACADPHFEAPAASADARRVAGLWRSGDNGANWELLLEGEATAVAINPADPAIIHVAVQEGAAAGFAEAETAGGGKGSAACAGLAAGIYGSLDRGASWYVLGGPSMERRQRRFNSVSHNPHNPAEVWVAHFGSSFSRAIDPAVRDRIQSRLGGANLAQNGGLSTDGGAAGTPRHWTLKEAAPATDASLAESEPIAAFVRDPERGSCVRFRLTPERAGGPSPRAADREQRRLEAAGLIPVDAEWAASPENRADTRCWLQQRLPPHVAQLARGKSVRIGLSLKVLVRRERDWWLNWAESCEVERFPPQLVLYELRERNLGVPVAETSLEAAFQQPKDYLGRWVDLSARGRVSARAMVLLLVLTGSANHTAPLEAFATGISLRIDE